MRLWHYKLIPYLPNSQLLAQWRELNSIFKKQDSHILINYVYEYPLKDLFEYTNIICQEFRKRGFHNNVENMKKYFKNYEHVYFADKGYCAFTFEEEPFKKHHTDRYLLQCFYNLQEKYDRGQKDFSEEQYNKLVNFMKGIKMEALE